MKNLILIAVTVATLQVCPASASAAQAAVSVTPNVENARVENRALSGPLVGFVNNWMDHATAPQWLGYAFPQVSNDRTICCGDYNSSRGDECGTCRLEHGRDNMSLNSNQSGTVRLDGPRYLLVLFRAENRQLMKIRVASEDCTLDAGGLPFLWLTGVAPAESVALLETFVAAKELDAGEGGRLGNAALTAIAMHADPAADRALESFVQPSQPESLRKQTAFWLGAARGAAGLRVLQNMAKSEASTDVRAHITFALSVSHEPGALSEMIRMARSDGSPHVRGQALFWLAHKAGEKAVGTITGAIQDDPDTEVKKKAVFALSQLPKDEGVPKLIEVAQTNRNREVRKQAMFWLGQSNDSRALAFFEQILSR